MQNKAHALAAGIFVLLVSALAAAMAVWLTRESGERVVYELSTRDGVTGLRVEAAVRYRGVPVGKVSAIGLDPQVRGNVLVRIRVEDDTPITRSTFATLGYQGVTGSTYVQLDDSGESNELLTPTDGTPLRIPLKPGLVGSLAERGQQLLGQVETTARRLNELLAPENQRKLFDTVTQIGSAAAGLERQSQAIQASLTQRLDPALASVPPLSEEATRTLKSLQSTSAELGRTATDISRLGASFARTSDDFSLAARRLTDKDGTLDRLARTSDSVEATANRMSRSNLPSALQATEDTARAARRVDRAASRLEDNPQQLIFGAGTVAPGPGEPGFTPPRKPAP